MSEPAPPSGPHAETPNEGGATAVPLTPSGEKPPSLNKTQPIDRTEDPGYRGAHHVPAEPDYSSPDQAAQQGYTGQPYPGQPSPAQPYPGQPPAGQSYPDQAYPAQGYPAQGYAPGYAGYPPVAPSNSMAVISMILGIVGVTFVPVLASIAALITGYSARRQIDERGEGGRGMAVAGIVLGWVGVALGVLGLLAFIAVIAFAGFAASNGSTY